jgi:hypothetical protein
VEVAVVSQPVFNQLNLTIRDMDPTVAFYRRPGFVIDPPAGAGRRHAPRADGDVP